MTVFLNKSSQKKRVAFGAPYPGKIIPIHLADIGGEFITQKDSFRFSRRRRASASALRSSASSASACSGVRDSSCSACWATGGPLSTPAAPCWSGRLAARRADPRGHGCIVGFQPSVNYEIEEHVGRIKSAIFGGEGLFFATLRGPGRVWLQSLPLSRLAMHRIIAAAPGVTRGGREEGSLLGGLGNILDGDSN